jgi:hypothetical protein
MLMGKGMHFIRISNFDRGEVIRRPAKASLRVSAPFLRSLHTALEKGALLDKLYGNAYICPIDDDGPVPNGYRSEFKLMAEKANSIFSRHMSDKGVRISLDEKLFFSQHILPALREKIEGPVYRSRINLGSQEKSDLKSDLLIREQMNILPLIRKYLRNID